LRFLDEHMFPLGTTCGTMNRKKLQKIKGRVDSLRRSLGTIRSQDLVRLMKKLGRRRAKRGKEPTYVSDEFPDARPITVPSHPGTLKPGTANSILDDIEGDVFLWEEALDGQESGPQTSDE
jgi:predicted RNA binding protein YcfA (HicA-like mRNA interferase family)